MPAEIEPLEKWLQLLLKEFTDFEERVVKNSKLEKLKLEVVRLVAA